MFKNNNILELVFDSIPDLIAVLNLNYKIVRINQAMADKLGLSPEEAIGLSCYELVHGTLEPPAFCPMQKLIKDGQNHTADVHEPNLGGFFMVTVNPIKSETGTLMGSVHIASNITSLKLSEEKFITIFKHVPIPIAISTVSNGRFLDVNHAWEEVFGFNKSEVMGKNAIDLALFIDLADREKLVTQFKEQGVLNNVRLNLYNKNGNLLFGIFSAAPIIIDGEKCWVTSFNNITEQVLLSDAISEFKQTVLSEARPELARGIIE